MAIEKRMSEKAVIAVARKTIAHYQHVLGLQSWQFSIGLVTEKAINDHMGDDRRYIATVHNERDEQMTLMRINKDIPWEAKRLRKVVLHELLHVVAAEVWVEAPSSGEWELFLDRLTCSIQRAEE